MIELNKICPGCKFENVDYIRESGSDCNDCNHRHEKSCHSDHSLSEFQMATTINKLRSSCNGLCKK